MVVKEEHVELHEAGAIFNPDWLARVADLRAVRFMDWMAHQQLADRRLVRAPAASTTTPTPAAACRWR